MSYGYFFGNTFSSVKPLKFVSKDSAFINLLLREKKFLGSYHFEIKKKKDKLQSRGSSQILSVVFIKELPFFAKRREDAILAMKFISHSSFRNGRNCSHKIKSNELLLFCPDLEIYVNLKVKGVYKNSKNLAYVPLKKGGKIIKDVVAVEETQRSFPSLRAGIVINQDANSIISVHIFATSFFDAL